MSTNTTIQEGGKGYPFGPVKCLMVEGDNGEFYPWYPEADRALDSLSVTQNGIYRASDRDVYGWNRVSVNVAQTDSVTGRDPETGQEVVVRPDPETGELMETVVPVEIRVTIPPMKTTYYDGESIDYDGMVVKAYKEDGNIWQDKGHIDGVIPLSELLLSVNTADISKSVESAIMEDTSGLINDPPVIQPVMLGPIGIKEHRNRYNAYENAEVTYHVISAEDAVYAVGLYTPNNWRIYLCSKKRFTYIARIHETDERRPVPERERETEYTAYLYNGNYIESSIWSTVQPPNDNVSFIGLYNELDNVSSRLQTNYATDIITIILGGVINKGQVIPVVWSRPEDGAILETSFNITVTGGE